MVKGLLALLALAAIPVGLLLAVSGFKAQHTEDAKYTVLFQYEGAECEAGSLAVDVSSGEPLECGLKGVTPLGPPEFKIAGFSAAQNAAVLKLSTDLARDGFTAVEQQQLAARVHQIADSLPPDKRPRHGWFWGAHQGWAAVGLGVVGLVVVIVMSVPAPNQATARRR